MPLGFLLGGHYEEHRPAQIILHLCVAFYQISVVAGFDESAYLESSPLETIKVGFARILLDLLEPRT